ncbi:hypothetical protein A2U01_0077484, partial [Trifolium medium]|nr:hypothetical protein [Trifolium medium]
DSGWGHLIQLPENKNQEGLGFIPKPSTKKGKSSDEVFGPFGSIFRSAGFIHSPPETNAIIEYEDEEEPPSFVTPGGICRNWTAVDVPSVVPLF